MLVGRYFQFFALSLTTLLVVEELPDFKTIDAGSSEASRVLSALSGLASGAKEVIVEMLSRPSGFFHVNGSNRSPLILALPPPPPSPPPSPSPSPTPTLSPPPTPTLPPEPLSDPPLEPPPESPPEHPPESPPESLQPPEPTPLTNTTSRFWRMDGSKIILELDLERIPGFDATRKVVGWVACWFGVLFPGGSGAGQSYWLHALVPAALGFFVGLGYGFSGWCWWCLSRKKAPQPVEEKVERIVVFKPAEPRDPADAYHESRLSQSYMMPLNFQRVPDPRLLRVSAPIAATKSERAEDTNAMIDMIAKKEEDADPMMVPPSFSDLSWYSPVSPTSPTQSNGGGLDLSSYDGFQPMPRSPHPNDLPDSLMGSFPLVAPPPRKPNLPQISDPWSNYTPDDPIEFS